MAGLFKAGDSVLHVFSEAIPGHDRVIDSNVIAEISQGQYQIATNLGIAIVVAEEKLAPLDGAPPVVPPPVPPDVAALLANTAAVQSNTDAIHGKDVQVAIDAAAVDVQAMADKLIAAALPVAALQAAIDAAASDVRAAADRLAGK
jgi:hypothetical protein